MYFKSQAYANALLKQAADAPLNLLCNKSFLVTGACGLIASTFIDYLLVLNEALDLNFSIYALDIKEEYFKKRFQSDRASGVLHFVEQDICAPLSLEVVPDYILHAASNAHPAAFVSDPVGTMTANIIGTNNILQYCKDSGARVLFLSTGETYGQNDDVPDSGYPEDYIGRIDTMNPRSCYPESKRAAETLCASYFAQYSLHTLVARCCYIYGPTISAGNTRADAQFLRNALAGQDIVMKSTGAQVRSYCYVMDAVRAMLVILLEGKAGQAYNIANSQSVASIKEYAETLASLAGVNVVFEIPDESEATGYSKVLRAVQSPAKLEQLGWQPKYKLHCGLSEVLAICKEIMDAD